MKAMQQNSHDQCQQKGELIMMKMDSSNQIINEFQMEMENVA